MDKTDKNKIHIALLGLGNIGTGTYKALEMNRKRIADNAGADIVVSRILEKDVDRDRGIAVPRALFTTNPDNILDDSGIDIVVELLGGVDFATELMLAALRKGKHVVTANKAALAANYEQLTGAARESGALLRFEASVGGGIPILNALTAALTANEYEEITGILNGTTNYILTRMSEDGMAYEEALREAQSKGFAEADPTADVEGHDVANKLSILISLAFGTRVRPEDIPTEGITRVGADDIRRAKAENARVKLIATARRENDRLTFGVKPTFLPMSHPLASVSDEFNAVFVRGNAVGDLMFYGKGAGSLPTGSAVLGDVIEIVRAMRARKG